MTSVAAGPVALNALVTGPANVVCVGAAVSIHMQTIQSPVVKGTVSTKTNFPGAVVVESMNVVPGSSA
jgi:hypothetical protein